MLLEKQMSTNGAHLLQLPINIHSFGPDCSGSRVKAPECAQSSAPTVLPSFSCTTWQFSPASTYLTSTYRNRIKLVRSPFQRHCRQRYYSKLCISIKFLHYEPQLLFHYFCQSALKCNARSMGGNNAQQPSSNNDN